jgi:4-amino-4-deoxy-L-arabinose transferase-like glycosyltransferase
VRMRVFFAHSTPNKRGEKMNVPAHRLLLGAILALSAFCNLSWLAREEYANVYYAATVKNMLLSWHNFFFASFDAGFVSVDKPPLGFWIQAVSAYLFGFHPWSLRCPRRSLGFSLWPCSTTWLLAASGRWRVCLPLSPWLSPP